MPLSLRTEKALARSEKNQNLPVNRLPPEVLQVVFSEEAEYSWGYYARLFRLRNVCKYWMEVVDSTPGLWRLISSIHLPELQSMILRNSKTQTLLVEYNERILENDPSGAEKMEAFASLMRPTASRWRKLDYYPALNSTSVAWILSLPFHNLHHLVIDGDTWNRYDQQIDAVGLQTLRVTRGLLNWLSLSGLILLKLDETDITLDELVAVLSASPSLGYLSLVETSSELGAEDAPNSSPNKILLPRLNHLDVYQFSVGSLSLLLDRIEAPSLGYFSIEGGYTADEAPEDCTRLFELAGRYIGAFPLPKGETEDQVFITVEDRVILLAIGARNIAVWNHSWTSESGPRERRDYLASFLNHLDERVGEVAKVLVLTCCNDGEVGSHLGILHARFPEINELVVKGDIPCEADMGVICRQLTSSSKLGSAGECTWLLPKLTKLRLDHQLLRNGGLSDVLRLVKIRKSAEQAEVIKELRINGPSHDIGSSLLKTLCRSVDLVEICPPKVHTTWNEERSKKGASQWLVEKLKLSLSGFGPS